MKTCKATLVPTDRCPFGCPFCFEDSTESGLDIDLGAAAECLWALAQHDGITLAELTVGGGGEPQRHPDNNALCAMCLAHHSGAVILTAGSSNTEELNRWAENPIAKRAAETLDGRLVQVSFDWRPESMDRMVKAVEPFSHTTVRQWLYEDPEAELAETARRLAGIQLDQCGDLEGARLYHNSSFQRIVSLVPRSEYERSGRAKRWSFLNGGNSRSTDCLLCRNKALHTTIYPGGITPCFRAMTKYPASTRGVNELVRDHDEIVALAKRLRQQGKRLDCDNCLVAETWPDKR